MRALSLEESMNVQGGSFLGMVVYGTIGFWVGGALGCFGGPCMSPAGAFIGMSLGIILGMDPAPQKVIFVDKNGDPIAHLN